MNTNVRMHELATYRNGGRRPITLATMAPRTWTISDIDGTNEREVTLAGYRAEIGAASVAAMAIFKASVPAAHRVGEALEARR